MLQDIDQLEDESTGLDAGNELFEHFRFVVDKGQTMVRIDRFLVDRIQNSSRTKIQSAAEAGNILVNDKPIKPSYKIKPNDVVSIVLEFPPKEVEVVAENIPIKIVYEDDQLLVVDKDPGMVVHPAFGHFSGTLVNALAWHLQNHPMFNKDTMDPRPGLVHRIDKDTSGTLVIAKTELSKNKLGKQFFDHSAYRRYVALVWGSFEEPEGTIEGNIGRSLKDRKIMAVFKDGDNGKPAVTHYKVLERLGYVTLVECHLETGRTHQIRVHMKSIGHPIFNDETYGGDDIIKGTTFTKYKQFVQNCFKVCPRQALHARELGFVHPTTGEFLKFDSPMPPDMEQLVAKWRSYVSNREIVDVDE